MRLPHRFHRLLAVAFLAIAVAQPLRAQLLRGTVRDSASAQPISGAVLVMLDSTGRALGRNITDEQGRYTIALTRAIARVQVLRIGFRPRTVTVPSDVTDATRLDVVMRSIPMLLPAVSVVDQPNCPRRPDRPAAFALWEQAKSALLATVVAREANPAEVLRLHFSRRMTRDDLILGQTVRLDSTSTTRPFGSPRSAAEFVDHGFADDRADGRWYEGPDAEVMLDPAFALGYCFEIARGDSSRPNQVGLGFRAARGKRGRVDIEGAVWIDSVSLSLTDIVFRYVGLGYRLEQFRPGGRISFRSMANGSVIIDRWFLRFASPVLEAGRTRGTAFATTLEARETGGEVARARWRDGREWQASLGRLRGQVIGQIGAGSVIQLIGTDYRAVADSTGSFQLSNLLPGPYAIGAIDARMGDLGILLKTGVEVTAARDSVVLVDVDVMTSDAYVAAKCDANAGNLTNAVLVARVLLPDGTAAEGAKVDVRVAGDGNLKRVAEGETDRYGLFHLCRVPRSDLQIHAELRGTMPATSIREVTGRITTVKLQLKPAKP